jgi:hypothetical protein
MDTPLFKLKRTLFVSFCAKKERETPIHNDLNPFPVIKKKFLELLQMHWHRHIAYPVKQITLSPT